MQNLDKTKAALLTGLPQPFPRPPLSTVTRTEVKKDGHAASSFLLLATSSYCGLPSSSASNPRAEYCRRLPLISPPPAVFLSPPIPLVVLPGGLRLLSPPRGLGRMAVAATAGCGGAH